MADDDLTITRLRDPSEGGQRYEAKAEDGRVVDVRVTGSAGSMVGRPLEAVITERARVALERGDETVQVTSDDVRS